MKMNILRDLIDAMRGKSVANDWDAFELALAEGIIGSLQDSFAIRDANRMILGCEFDEYEGAMKDAYHAIIRHLKMQGGALDRLAKKLDHEDGIQVKIGPVPDRAGVRIIQEGNLPVKVWFFLENIQVDAPNLIIKHEDWRSELEPGSRYTVGRSEESRDSTVMITISDAPKYVSRWQAEFECIGGVWHCTSRSDVPTYVDDRLLDGDKRIALANTKNGGQIKFGRGIPGLVIYYQVKHLS